VRLTIVLDYTERSEEKQEKSGFVRVFSVLTRCG